MCVLTAPSLGQLEELAITNALQGRGLLPAKPISAQRNSLSGGAYMAAPVVKLTPPLSVLTKALLRGEEGGAEATSPSHSGVPLTVSTKALLTCGEGGVILLCPSRRTNIEGATLSGEEVRVHTWRPCSQ